MSDKVSSREAVRLAVEKLGLVSNAELIAWVKQHYGYDVSKYISQYKNGAKKSLNMSGSASSSGSSSSSDAAPKRRGRPKGSVNKRKGSAAPAASAAAAPAKASAPAAIAKASTASGSKGKSADYKAIAHDLTILKAMSARYGLSGVKELLEAAN